MPNKKPASESTNGLPKLSAPAHRALASAKILNLADLAKFTEAQIAALHGMGPNALSKLADAMSVSGVKFKKA